MTTTSPTAALSVLLPGFEGAELPDWLRDRLADGLAGVCLFATNIASPVQLRELTAAVRAANPGAVVAIDEEGGDVTRLYQDVGSPYPGNAILGRIDDVGYTRTVAATVGAQLAAVGVTLDFAPDADINSDDANPVIGVRSFGADPELVSRHTAAWIEGLQSLGVAASAKHFPGHGDTSSDSHLAMPVVDVAMKSLRAMFGANVPEPEAMVFPRWLSDPWSRGGYSYPGLGSDPDDCTEHARPLGNRVFFAGEATEPVEYGTVHAALWSAEQTAETIFRLATGTAASRAARTLATSP